MTNTLKKKHKQRFTLEEDEKLIDLVTQFGINNWVLISNYFQDRNPRQVKDRWKNNLNPDINKKKFTDEEDILLKTLYFEYGPKWVQISKIFGNRTDVSLKSRWLVLKRKDLLKIKNNFIVDSKIEKTIEIMSQEVFNYEDNVFKFF